jgi:hypothetical protein
MNTLIRLSALVIANNGGSDGCFGGFDRQLFQYCYNPCARVGVIFGMLPGIATRCWFRPFQFKDLNEAIPNDLTLEFFLDTHGIAMMRLAVVQFLNRFFKQFNVVHAAILARLNMVATMLGFQIRTPPENFKLL